MTSTATKAPDAPVVPEWELCDRLRRSLRLLPDIDNTEIAEIMGVQRTTVSTWLSGRRKPSRAVLMVWADMTGVDLAWLEHGNADELRARRDSNPKPSDLESQRPRRRAGLVLVHSVPFVQDSVKATFTPNRLRVVS